MKITFLLLSLSCLSFALSARVSGATNAPSSRPTAFSWPLPSYLEAEEMIGTGQPAKAVQLLEKEMAPPFPYGFDATAGYKIGFFYFRILGDALAADNKPVEAYEAYRDALRAVPLCVVTSSPVPYAKAIYGLGKQLMTLHRWADAEDALAAALRLAANRRLRADYHWVRSVRASALGERKEMAKEAEKCIEAAPNYNWAAWHHAALAKYACGDHVAAIDGWLDGLSAFVYALPITDAPAYLNRALPYWKSATDEQIARYYDELHALVLSHPANKSNEAAITRLLMERLKLEKLFPGRFKSGDAGEILKQAAEWEAAPDGVAVEWSPSTNPVYCVTEQMLCTNAWERIVNKALWHHARDESGKARKLYEWVISPTGAPDSCEARIQGYTPRYFATAHLAFWAAELEDSEKGMRDMALGHAREAVRLVVSNKAGRGVYHCPEEFYRLLMSKGGLEKRSGNAGKCFAAWQWASTLSPESVDPRQCLLKHEADVARLEGDIETVALKMNEFFKLPLERPWYKYRHDQAYLYWQLGDRGLWKSSETPTRKALDVMLDGFEIGIFDFACHWHEFCNAHFRSLDGLDLFNDLLWHERAGEFEEDQYERLYKLLGRFGVTIPARFSEASILADVVRWRRHFSAVDRDASIELSVRCDASPWRDKDTVFLWTDVLAKPIEMRRANETNDLWTAAFSVPPPTFLVRYQFYRSSADTPVDPAAARHRQVFLVADPEGKMTLEATTERDHPITVIFQCDARQVTVSNAIYIVGDQPELGNWKPNAVRLCDDGTHGDKTAGDGIWTLAVEFAPSVRAVKYKFTNSGKVGTREGEEFPEVNRTIDIPDNRSRQVELSDVLGRR